MGSSLLLCGGFFGCRGLLDDLCSCGDHAAHIGEIDGDDHGVVFFGQIAELIDVLLSDLEVHGFCAAGLVDDHGDLFQALGSGFGYEEDFLGAALCFVDALLLFTFGDLHGFLAQTFGEIGRASWRERV